MGTDYDNRNNDTWKVLTLLQKQVEELHREVVLGKDEK